MTTDGMRVVSFIEDRPTVPFYEQTSIFYMMGPSSKSILWPWKVAVYVQYWRGSSIELSETYFK